jgi:hypothetical protein
VGNSGKGGEKVKKLEIAHSISALQSGGTGKACKGDSKIQGSMASALKFGEELRVQVLRKMFVCVFLSV